MGVLIQVIATVLLCFSCMNMSLINSWPSSTILLFKSVNTTLHRPMDDIEIAVLGSIPVISAMVSIPLAAMILDRLGRKYTVMLTSMIFVISWSIIAVSNRVEVILAAVTISGLGYGVFIEVIIYISEIAQDSIRGTLTASANQFCGFGYLVSYFLGGAVGYYGMVYTCLSLAIVSTLMIAVLKESPMVLMKKGKVETSALYDIHDVATRLHWSWSQTISQPHVHGQCNLGETSGNSKEAAKSLAFYRHSHSTSKEVLAELKNIRLSLNSDFEDAELLTGEEETFKRGKSEKTSCWEYFKTTPSTRREFYLVMMLKTAFACQGLPAVQVYAEPMFAAAVGDVISPNMCSVIMGLVVLIAGVVAAYLVDVVGRRPLQIYSSIATGICCVLLGIQLMTEVLPKWTVPLFIYVFATSHTVGAGTVPFVIAAEVFLPEVKSIFLVLTVEWSLICQFFVLFLFNILTQSVGLAPVFYFFSFVCFATAGYFYYFLPETKGLPVYAIQELFKKNK